MYKNLVFFLDWKKINLAKISPKKHQIFARKFQKISNNAKFCKEKKKPGQYLPS
jgi:hypothetical protein